MKLQNRFCKKLSSLQIKGKRLSLFCQCISPTVNGDDGNDQGMCPVTEPIDRNEKFRADQQGNFNYTLFNQSNFVL